MVDLDFVQIVRDVAADYGKTVTDDEADAILWNRTGFPTFWTGDPITCCAQQVDDFFAGVHSCCGCSCHVCAEGHNTDMSTPHTEACRARFDLEIAKMSLRRVGKNDE